MLGGPSTNSGSIISADPTALNALTTRALGSQRCTVSPAESVNPIESSGDLPSPPLSGLVTSITILPSKFLDPARSIALFVPRNFVASTRISPNFADPGEVAGQQHVALAFDVIVEFSGSGADGDVVSALKKAVGVWSADLPAAQNADLIRELPEGRDGGRAKTRRREEHRRRLANRDRRARGVGQDDPWHEGLASRLHVIYLDTGAMYRALAFLALQTRTDVDNEDAARSAVRWAADSRRARIRAPRWDFASRPGAELDEEALHSNEVTAIVSTFAALPARPGSDGRRAATIASEGPVVMAGRDIWDGRPSGCRRKNLLDRVGRGARRATPRAAWKPPAVDVARSPARRRNRRTRPLGPQPPPSRRWWRHPTRTFIDSSSLTAQQVADEIERIVNAAAGR